MTSTKEPTRSRAPNFTREEQEIFLKIIEPYIPIIECKKTDCIKQVDKQKAWALVTSKFNSCTSYCPRTTENLISCYRNMKSKVKKQHSEAKMMLRDNEKKEAFIRAIEENGKDWPAVSQVINTPVEICQVGMQQIHKEIKKSETKYKKKVLGTGGGPPPSNEDPLDRLKRIIEPQIDGLYTIYDGDSELMKQFQENISESDRVQPIEVDFIETNISLTPEHVGAVAGDIEEDITQKTDVCIKNNINSDPWVIPSSSNNVSRTNILKKKLDPALNSGIEKKKRKNIGDNFAQLTAEKLTLTKINQEVAAEELKERKINVQIKEQEMAFNKNIHELQLQNLTKENIYKEEMRRKELLLIDIKIENLQRQ